MYQDPDHNHKAYIVAIITLFVVGLIIGLVIGVTVVKSKNKTYIKTVNQTGVAVDNTIVSASSDLADNISQMKDVTIFPQLLDKAGMKDYLHNVGPCTVLLPEDSAFKALDQNKLNKLENNPAQAKQLVLNNMISGTLTSADLRVMAARGQTVTAMSGQKLKLQIVDSKLQISDGNGNISTLDPTDAIAANGVIHGSNQIMASPGIDLKPAAD